MDELLDIDELMAIQEEEQDDFKENEEDLEVLREWENEMKETRTKRALFNTENMETESKETEELRLKRIRSSDTTFSLEDLPADLDDISPRNEKTSAKSPLSKRIKLMNESVQSVENEQCWSWVSSDSQNRILNRIPDGDYQYPIYLTHLQSVTYPTGERFYLRVSSSCKDEPFIESTSLKSLCGVPYRVLFNQALQELDKMDNNMPIDNVAEEKNEQYHSDSGFESDDDTGKTSLWVEKFRPRSYIHLLSDDGTNRKLLQWLKLWDKKVFNREIKIKKKALEDTDIKSNKKGFQKFQIGPDVIEELDSTNRPVQKIALLHGPPGLGKTTLAHVIALHAGYNVVEMNASDDRSLSVFKNKLKAATEMRSANAKDQRPNCLIIDEIDGSPAPTVNFLVSVITQKDTSRKKKQDTGILQRPIICICNDLYTPSLRTLKQHCLIFSFPPTLRSRLAQRLMDITRHEKLTTDMTALMALCEKTGDDIRSCLSILQFFKSRGNSVKASDIHKTTIGQKDSQKSLFTVWKEIFTLPRGTVKRMKEVDGNVIVQEENAGGIPLRYSTMLSTVYACGDYDKLLTGVFENYLNVKFKDGNLQNVNLGLEWFRFFDEAQHCISTTQNYQAMGYMPFTFLAAHFYFAAASKSKITYPQLESERSHTLKKNQNLLQTLISDMTPHLKQFISASSLVTDVLPYFLAIIQPNLRPVNTQLYSFREKEELNALVRTMLQFNLNYRQERTPEGQYVYKLDPPVDEIAKFSDISTRRDLSYGLKQLIAREIELEKMRHETSELALPVESKSSGKDNDVSRAADIPRSSLPSHLQKLQAKQIDDKAKLRRPVDFFGRPLNPDAIQKKSETEKNEVSHVITSDIWFKFKEGYNNAVRRNLRMKDLW